MDRRAYLWSDLDLRFVSFKSNYIAGKMYAEQLQKDVTKLCAKSCNNGYQ